MAERNGQELMSTWVPKELASAFKEIARRTDGGTAGALRRLVAKEVENSAARASSGQGCAPLSLVPRGAGRGEQVGVRLKAAERAALDSAARSQGTSPANWIRSLALVHLARRPQWNPDELAALRDLFRELRAIGHNMNQTAQTLHAGSDAGEASGDQGLAALQAAEIVRREMRRVVAIMTGNFDYWGLPDSAQPTPLHGAVDQSSRQAQEAEERRRVRPRRRLARFSTGD